MDIKENWKRQRNAKETKKKRQMKKPTKKKDYVKLTIKKKNTHDTIDYSNCVRTYFFYINFHSWDGRLTIFQKSKHSSSEIDQNDSYLKVSEKSFPQTSNSLNASK